MPPAPRSAFLVIAHASRPGDLNHLNHGEGRGYQPAGDQAAMRPAAATLGDARAERRAPPRGYSGEVSEQCRDGPDSGAGRSPGATAADEGRATPGALGGGTAGAVCRR